MKGQPNKPYQIINNVGSTFAGLQKTKRRWRRRFVGCLLLAIVGVLLACSFLFWLTAQALAAPAKTVLPLAVTLLIDNSNSMFDKGGIGSDPALLRLDAAGLFISYLGVDDKDLVHACSVIFFGDQAELVVPLTPLVDDATRLEIFNRIQNPPRQRWTDQAGALALAISEQSALITDTHRPAFILLTDGKGEWDNTNEAHTEEAYIQQLQQLGAEIADADIPLFIILLANEATDADEDIATVWKPLWQELAAGTTMGRFYEVRQAQDLPDIYHDIVVALTGSRTKGPIFQGEVGAAGLRQTVPVNAGLARLTFVVGKSAPDLAVTILKPNNNVLSVAESGVRHAGQSGEGLAEIWVIDDPQPGDWTVLITGAGHVTVWQDYRSASATVTPTALWTPTTQPLVTSTPQPTAAPVLQIDGFSDETFVGQSITWTAVVRPQQPVTMIATVIDPEGTTTSVPVVGGSRYGDAVAQEGVYTGSIRFAKPGQHLVTITATNEQQTIAGWTAQVWVAAVPQLVLTIPNEDQTLRTGDVMELDAAWQVAGNVVALTGNVLNGRAVWSDESETQLSFTEQTNGRYHAAMALTQAGPLTLTLEAQAQMLGGMSITDTTSYSTVVARSPAYGAWLFVLLIGLGGSGGGVYLWRQQRRPFVTGSLHPVYGPGFATNETLIELDGLKLRRVRLGAPPADIPLVGTTERLTIRPGGSLGGCYEMLASGTSGVLLNEKPLLGEQLLKDTDVVSLGNIRLRYENLRLRTAYQTLAWSSTAASF